MITSFTPFPVYHRVVVITAGDKDRLATLNAHLIRINLVCAISSPIVVGFLMSIFSDAVSIGFQIVWNFLSIFLGDLSTPSPLPPLQ